MGNKKKQRPHHTPPDRKSKVVPSSAVLPGVHNSGERWLYGFLHDNVFHVIWWDPHHEIFPSKLKKT